MMCAICKEETSTIFVFPQQEESLTEWVSRLRNHDYIQLGFMSHSDENLVKIADSYDLQGFTYQDHVIMENGQTKPFFNVLFLRDLVFVTYGKRFAKSMGWEHESHV